MVTPTSVRGGLGRGALYPRIEPGSECTIPEPVCRTLPKVNPDYPTIYEHNAAWVRRFFPFPSRIASLRMLEYRYPLWDCLLYPTGLAGRVLHMSCVTSLMFTVDDLAAARSALFDDINADWIANHAFGSAFADIWSTLKRNMPESVYRRYRKGWQDCFVGFVSENDFRARHEVPDLSTYLDIRRLSIGMAPYLAGAEYVHDFDIAELIKNDQDLFDAGRSVFDHVILANDLLSFSWEYFSGDYFNSVCSLIYAHGHNLQDAVDITGEMIRMADSELAHRCELLRRRYILFPQVQIYLDTLNSICAGNLRWALETPRYIGHGRGWNGLRSGRIRLQPDRMTLESVSSDTPLCRSAP
ncbi:terpene synthase [Nocardia terpenica]|uniref:terpene synthase family protein n=1 Tax=Nocardia terpenica TaxID=455432 RepID=UPI002FDF9FEF